MWFLRKAGSQKKVTKVGPKTRTEKNPTNSGWWMTSFSAPKWPTSFAQVGTSPWPSRVKHSWVETPGQPPGPPPFPTNKQLIFVPTQLVARNRSSEPNDLVSLSESVGNSQVHWNSIPSLSMLPTLQLQDQIWNLHLQNHRPEIGSGGFKEAKFKVCIYWITGNLYINFGISIISMSHCW